MTTAEKLATIAENELKVHEAGEKSEYDRFWDAFQTNGTRTTYSYVFCGFGWTDEVYQPKYNFDSVKTVNNMYFYSRLTDTKLPINLTGVTNGNTTAMFHGSAIKTIRTLTVDEKTVFSTTFNNCSALENITFEGTIATNGLNLQWSPLSPDSMKSVILHLKNFAGTEYEGAYSVTFSETCWAALDAEGATAPNGDTWRNYMRTLGWSV